MNRNLLPGLAALAVLLAVEPACAQGFLWPLGNSATVTDPINSPFGPRIRNSVGTYEFHEGIDLAAALGTLVHAAAGGTVRRLTDANGCDVTTANAMAGPGSVCVFPGGGRTVQIDHGLINGVRTFTLYFHLSRHADELDVNDPVVAGQAIGEVGQTGNASHPHLHFEVRRGTPNRVDAENPLGELASDPADAASTIALAQVITQNGAPVVEALIEAVPDDLNLNRVAVAVRDAQDQPVAQTVGTEVNFNERINAGFGVANPSNGIVLLPAVFRDNSAVYRLTVQFAGLVLPAGSTFQITATDESGLASQSGWIAIP